MRVYPCKKVTPQRFYLDEIWPEGFGNPNYLPYLVIRKRWFLGFGPKIVDFGVLVGDYLRTYAIAERYCHLLNVLYKPRKRGRKRFRIDL